MFKRIAVIVAVTLLPTAVASSVGRVEEQCAPTPEQMAAYVSGLEQPRTASESSIALVGVDVLGRVAIALDIDRDGFADEVLKFTDSDRLPGPWARLLDDARVKVKHGSVEISSKAQQFGLAISVRHAKHPKLPKWAKNVVNETEGRELVRLENFGFTVQLGGLDHNSIHSWPESLWTDMLAPGTESCVTFDCDVGGIRAASCGIQGCPQSPTGCFVAGCTPTQGCPKYFSCCKCTDAGTASCGCRICYDYC